MRIPLGWAEFESAEGYHSHSVIVRLADIAAVKDIGITEYNSQKQPQETNFVTILVTTGGTTLMVKATPQQVLDQIMVPKP